jgi:hypothetical protein
MPVVDENRILGNYGVNLVSYILSKYCLVRPVAEGTDIGIDLYCETVVEGQPFLHFWAQVKAGKGKINIRNDGNASYSFKVDHLRYWKRQPVPVFAFYVPCKYPPQVPKYIYVRNISDYLQHNELPDQDTKAIASSDRIRVDDNGGWHTLLFKELPVSTASLKLRDGIIGKIPELKEGYVKEYPFPPGVSLEYAKTILHTIRTTVGSIVQDAALLKHTKSIDPNMVEIESFVQISRIFEPVNRPEINAPLALWTALVEKDKKNALAMIDSAMRPVEKDKGITAPIKKAWLKRLNDFKNIIVEADCT